MTTNQDSTFEKAKKTGQQIVQDVKDTVKTGTQKISNEVNKNDVPQPQKDLDTPVKQQQHLVTNEIENTDPKENLVHNDENVDMDKAPQKTTMEKASDKVHQVKQNISDKVNELNQPSTHDPQRELDTPTKQNHDIIAQQIDNTSNPQKNLQHNDDNVNVKTTQSSTMDKIKDTANQVKDTLTTQYNKASNQMNKNNVPDPKNDLDTNMQQQHNLINQEVTQEVHREPTTSTLQGTNTTTNTTGTTGTTAGRTTMDRVKDTVNYGIQIVKDTVNTGVQKVSNRANKNNVPDPQHDLDTPVKQQQELVNSEIQTQTETKEPEQDSFFMKTFKKMASKVYGARKSSNTVFITGCSRGIGLELVKHFIGRNYFVIATCRNSSKAKELNELQQKHKDECIVLNLDVTNSGSIRYCVKTMGDIGITGIDILINNAGIMVHDETILKSKKTDMIQHFQVNTIAPIEVFQNLYPLLKSQKNCKVINMSTIIASCQEVGKVMEMIECPSYRMSKSALNMATRLQAQIHTKNEGDMLFAAVHPGWVDTDLGSNNGAMTPDTKVEDCAKEFTTFVLDTFNNINQSGKFFDRNGKELPW